MICLRILKAAPMAAALILSSAAMAGRPLAVDDADPADAGQVEVEAGASYEKDEGWRHWDVPFGLAYGVGSGVELGLGFGGQFEQRTERAEGGGERRRVHEHDIGDLTLAAKWRLVEACPLGARHALVPSVKLPTADEDKDMGSGDTDWDVTWIVSRSMGGRTGLHANIGYSWIGGPDDDVVHYGVAVDVQLAESVQWVGEVFAEREASSGAEETWLYASGFRWVALDGLTLDVAAGSKLSSEGPDFVGTVGFTWAFGTGN